MAPERPSGASGAEAARRLYRRLLARFGLGQVACTACARALLPAPFDWESYTYSAGGRRWTWDVACARALVARRSDAERLVLDPVELAAWLAEHGHVDESHLAHLPPERLEEPVLLAPVPDGQGHVLIDGAHRATVRIRSGLSVHAFLLSPAESLLAVEVAPLARRCIAQELRRQGLLPGDHQP
jgi:hypothetical protein